MPLNKSQWFLKTVFGTRGALAVPCYVWSLELINKSDLLENRVLVSLGITCGALHNPPPQPQGLCSHKPLNLGDTTPGGCEAEGCVEPQHA